MKAQQEETTNVTVVIPCHNEAASIAKVIARFPRDELRQRGVQLHLVVVDNNSSDDTTAIAETAGATVVWEPNKGKGNALRTGFRHVSADTDFVVMLDGDDTYSPEEIMRLIEPLQSGFCDVVIGSRLCGHVQQAAMTKLNHLGNRIFTGITRLLYGANITDVLTGYFAWKKTALDALSPHIKSPGFAVEMEMITKMARLGQRMAAVPISYHPRAGQSNLHPFKDGYRILLMLLQNLVWRPRLSLTADVKTPNGIQSAFMPRTIIFVSDGIYPYVKGGKEKRLHEITKHLAAMNHDVHVYTMQWWRGPDMAVFEDGVYFHAICKRYAMYHGDRRSIKEALIFGIACLKLLRERFDILDVDHMPFFPVFSTWIVCVLRGRKLYATWHEALSRKEWTSYMGRGGTIAAFIQRLCVRLPYRITAASWHTRDSLATMYGRVERVELVPPGIDSLLLQTVRPAAVQLDVLYVGRLVKDKHVDQLILAISIITKTYPDIRCIIIGEGIEASRLKQQVSQYGLQKNITFLGAVPEATDVYAYMKAAKVFCSPSVREGFGITSLEALGCGTPVITIDSPANAARHLIQDGQNGSVVPLDASAIAKAILYWTATDRQPEIAAQTLDYDWNQLAKKQAEVYML